MCRSPCRPHRRGNGLPRRHGSTTHPECKEDSSEFTPSHHDTSSHHGLTLQIEELTLILPHPHSTFHITLKCKPRTRSILYNWKKYRFFLVEPKAQYNAINPIDNYEYEYIREGKTEYAQSWRIKRVYTCTRTRTERKQKHSYKKKMNTMSIREYGRFIHRYHHQGPSRQHNGSTR